MLDARAGSMGIARLPRFVVDTMLGRLARWLRALGYDTLYPGQVEDRRLLRISRAEERILVTRDRMLARLGEPLSCLIHSDLVDEQLREAVERLSLSAQEAHWLSRCLPCNAVLEPRERESLRGNVPEHIFATQAAFMACPSCTRIYWAGSHADRMLERLQRVFDRAERR
jgi:uncharacterized protein with PIN domain